MVVSGNAMTNIKEIPEDIYGRLKHFQDEVNKHFSFLTDFNYVLENLEIGRTDAFLNYFCNFSYRNGDTLIRIDYSTDIIKGQTLAFPKEKQRPVVDNLVSCSISDPNAFMSVGQFAEETQANLPQDHFSISLDTKNAKEAITRVVKNYSNFFQDNLASVLKKEKIYDCYIDRFYDKVFKEKHYR